jgi:DNA gyrase subunit A
LKITDKTGELIAIKAVGEQDDLMIINHSGVTIRMPVDDIRVMGRKTQGVRLINLDEDDVIADVAVIHNDESQERPVHDVHDKSEEE